MAYSTQRAVSDGTMTYLDISINYRQRADISVFFNDVAAPVGSWAWVGTTDKRISFTTAVPTGTEVLVARTTTLSKIINVFASGAKFNNSTMDDNFLQLLYLNQEAVEGSGLSDVFNDVNFHGFKLKNVGEAVDDTDVVTFGQVKTWSSSAYNAELAAEAARDLAIKWASQLTTTVDGTSYSAKQYALNAAASASTAAGAASTANDKAASATASAASSNTSALNADASRAQAQSARDDAQAAAAPATDLVNKVNAATSAANAATSAVATAMQKSANLSDVASVVTARANLAIGGRVLLDQVSYETTPGQTRTFQLPTGYDSFEIEWEGVVGSTTATSVGLQFSSDGGATFVTSSTYIHFFTQAGSSGSAVTSSSSTIGFWELVAVQGQAVNTHCFGKAKICRPAGFQTPKYQTGYQDTHFWTNDGTMFIRHSLFTCPRPSTPFNAFRLITANGSAVFPNGNITAGIFKLYGVL